MFKVPLKKENNYGKLITYKLKFIDSNRFMAASLSSLTDNLSEINKCKCKNSKEQRMHIKLKKDLLICRCKKCNNKSYISIDTLKEKFPNTYRFCNKNNDKFLLLLRKGVYPYEYMDNWERFNETKLPDKKPFYNKLNLEDITNEDYKHGHKVWDISDIKNLDEYHDLYLETDTLLLTDVYERIREICLEIYQLDPAHFLSTPGLAWQACLKKQE